MNGQLLIDAVVQQVTILIAQLATSGGVRAPVAHIANQVFEVVTYLGQCVFERGQDEQRDEDGQDEE